MADLPVLDTAEQPLVRELTRQPGQHDTRWIHLLGPVEVAAARPDPVPVDREAVLAGGADARDQKVRTSYAAVAASYAERLGDELAGLPFETWLLRRVADLAGDTPVIEVGTGPGHVAAFLADAGADAAGWSRRPRSTRLYGWGSVPPGSGPPEA